MDGSAVYLFSVDHRRVNDIDLLACLDMFPKLDTILKNAGKASGQPDAELLQAFINDFRYDRDLVSREDLDTWLAERHLQASVFLEAISRLFLAKSEPCATGNDSHEATDLRAICWCSSEFESAVVNASQWLLFADPVEFASAELRSLLRTGKENFDKWVLAELSSKDLEALLHNRRLDYTQVALTSLLAECMHVAREVRLCWQEGSWKPEDFPWLASVQVFHYRARMLDLEPTFRTQLLSKLPGDVLEPSQTEEGWTVVGLDSRTSPTLDDPFIQDELKALLLRPRLDKLGKDRIIWQVRP